MPVEANIGDLVGNWKVRPIEMGHYCDIVYRVDLNYEFLTSTKYLKFYSLKNLRIK